MSERIIKNIFITGPTGSIGSSLIEYCINNEIKVTALCREDSKRATNIPASSSVNVIYGNLDKLNEIEISTSERFDCFFHLGWISTIGNGRNNAEVQQKNIQYTKDAVYLAQRLGCRVFIGAGSQAEYGRQNKSLDNNTDPKPETEYGKAKLSAGILSRKLCNELGMDHIWCRILSVYGINDNPNSLIMSEICSLINGENFKCTAGEQIWDFLYSKDAARALMLIAQKGKNNKVYILGSGRKKKLYDYINCVKECINTDANVDFGAIDYSENQVMHLTCDTSDLIEDIGFYPEYSFEDGIVDMIKLIEEDKNES